MYFSVSGELLISIGYFLKATTVILSPWTKLLDSFIEESLFALRNYIEKVLSSKTSNVI